MDDSSKQDRRHSLATHEAQEGADFPIGPSIGEEEAPIVGEPNHVTLPESKRARNKSKSPLSREGAKVVVTQANASEERSIKDLP